MKVEEKGKANNKTTYNDPSSHWNREGFKYGEKCQRVKHHLESPGKALREPLNFRQLWQFDGFKNTMQIQTQQSGL